MHNKKVVSNTTPIIALSRTGCLWLLEKMYGEIYIPQAVFNEIVAKNDYVSEDVQNNMGWIIVETIRHTRMRQMFSSSLHSGEVETLILADETNADIVLIDDFLARKYAIQAGMNLSGTIGVLLKAKEKGLVGQVKPLLEDMIRNGIYLNKQLYEDALHLADE
jgi:predicted nucleic acid-binding protein